MTTKSDYKIVIIGESMVGKTSILLRYIQGKFIKIKEEDRTVNTSCFKKIINMNGMTFSINIWDTAGEEKYHALAPMFYRNSDGAVIVFDVNKRESFDLATKWFEEVNRFSEKSITIILVGNKIDLDKREVSNQEARELAEKYKGLYLEVSALTGRNIEEIFNSLTMEIYYHKATLVRKPTKGKLVLSEVKNEEVAEKKKKGGCC